jgi:hypothetical protein
MARRGGRTKDVPLWGRWARCRDCHCLQAPGALTLPENLFSAGGSYLELRKGAYETMGDWTKHCLDGIGPVPGC